MVISYSLFSEYDIDLFKCGKHYDLFNKFGSHILAKDGQVGCYFSIWAPSANQVFVIGDFNKWNRVSDLLNVRWDESGIWEGFIPGNFDFSNYKFLIISKNANIVLEKSDPFARFSEIPPKKASKVVNSKFLWSDSKWILNRILNKNKGLPNSIYEVHLASWRRSLPNNELLTYKEIAVSLCSYVKDLAFTHVELMPIMEYPYEPSWGYQITGYFSPTSRFGSVDDFKFFINHFHKQGIGVILDWVPSHFPSDANGLGFFDGSNLYEHPDIRKGYQPDWQSLIFNYGRNEVRSFLISNAFFWLKEFHVDGFRVDAVASMLYLDYSRNEGDWEPNIYGGRENLDSVSFIKELNSEISKNFEGIQTIAEESTAFPQVTTSVENGGLGFDKKWMMGWMNDTLNYFKRDTIYRKFHHYEITFSLSYAFTENFVLPLSHDEVVHGKASLLMKMPGDKWQKFANLRLLYGYMFAHPGNKLLFMGSEIAQVKEWNFDASLDWHLLEIPEHKKIQDYIRALNQLYTSNPALYEKQFSSDGFEWINGGDTENCVINFIRKGNNPKDDIIVLINFSSNVIQKYRIGLPRKGNLMEVLNSDNPIYGGSGVLNSKTINSEKIECNGREFSAEVQLPPLAVTFFKYPTVRKRNSL
jgi:1,4-alpha-glucan branching enzyme